MSKKTLDLVPLRAESVPLTVEAAAGVDVERYRPALDVLAEGKSMELAARAAGVDVRSLYRVFQRHPTLAAEIESLTSTKRRITRLKAMGAVENRLDDAANISSRDLTDILRSTRPGDDESTPTYRIVMDV